MPRKPNNTLLSKQRVKHTGATFTPRPLADYLAEKLLHYTNQKTISVLDPACGDGELLLAMGEKLHEKGISFALTGYDANALYLEAAASRIRVFNHTLIKGDFLTADDARSGMNYEAQSTKDKGQSIANAFDMVIANPPYVRTQALGAVQARDLARKFGLKGRVDLYYPFLIAMTASLREGGLLGVITSNRYLFTRSGESIRHFLSAHFEIMELIDLGDTKLFNAAVLPAIFIGRKQQPRGNASPTFIKIYEALSDQPAGAPAVSSVYDILAAKGPGTFMVGKRTYNRTDGLLEHEHTWRMLSHEETAWVKTIEQATHHRVGDLFKVSVGIKTTADKVFISDRWNDLGPDKPEDELLRELLSQENINAWTAVENTTLKVLYPHYDNNGMKGTVALDDYPKAKRYLLAHEETLRARKYLADTRRQWFELWVPQKPAQWNLPKLVFPDISITPRFYFDPGGKVVNGNCYWIAAANPNDVNVLLLIQGIANSALMTRYHDLVFNNKLFFGRRRYLAQYVEKYPLPDLHTREAATIIEIVQQLNASANSSLHAELKTRLETSVLKAFNLE